MANISEPKHWSGYVVECYDCGFVYDSWHTLEGGGYDCPACNEVALGTENRRLNSRVFVILEDNKQLRKVLEKIRDAKPTIRNSISEFSGTPAFYYIPPNPTTLQEIAKQALKGGGSDGLQTTETEVSK